MTDTKSVISTGFYGREVLTTQYDKITSENIVEVLHDVVPTFERNVGQIEYLYNYYKGKQAILHKVKKVRPEINYKIPVNRANEIISFKRGYLVGEPLQYVLRADTQELIEDVHRLNDFMLFERKANKDLQLAKWFYVCGTAYRLILPNKLETSEDGSAPFRIYTLSPMRAFVVYSDTVEGLPVLGVKVSYDADDTTKMHPIYNCYSDNMFFKVQDDKIIKAEPHILGGIPIIEYPANDERLGAFEIVLPLLDAINITASGRIDGLEQFIQSLMKFVNADISTEDFEKLKDLGCIKVKDTNGTAQIEFMDHELNQTQIQTLIDWEYDAVLTIVGMPNRNGGSSTSDTGAAVIMRDGWSDAEARAKEDENMFKDSETEFLKIALRICRLFNELSLNIWNVDVRFTRRNYENIEQKSTVLTTLLASGKVHPKLAFEHCGMFTDPTLAYEMSKSYIEEQEKKAEEQANRQIEGQANTESADKEGSDVKD